MLTWTDQPYTTMWAHLRFLSHEFNSRRLLRNDLGRARKQPVPPDDLLNRKAAQLAYCILQAHEYYQAAETVTINTSPLLFFYGMLSLAKAVIVANHPLMLLDDIKFHGLQHEKNGRASTLDNQTAILNRGVYDEFVKVVAGFRFPRGAAFQFKTLLSISPELSATYERYYLEKSRCIYLHDIRSESQNRINVSVIPPAGPFKDEAYARIPELAEHFDVQPQLQHQRALSFISKPTLNSPPEYAREYNPVVGGRYIVAPLPFMLNNVEVRQYVSPPVSDYISMYILSDCVRYQLWGSVVQGKETGVLGITDLFVAASKRRFPNLILNELHGEIFEYGSPGRLM